MNLQGRTFRGSLLASEEFEVQQSSRQKGIIRIRWRNILGRHSRPGRDKDF